MPTPVFIICSESGAVDRFTNLVSIHNVFDRLIVKQRQPDENVPATGSPWLSFRVTAVWRSSEEEREGEFEHETLLVFPGQDDPAICPE